MSQEEVYQRLQVVFDNVFISPVSISPELTAHDVEEWDSILQITLVLAVEDEFEIRFNVGEVESTKNVADLVELILKRASREVKRSVPDGASLF